MPTCHMMVGLPGSGKSTWIANNKFDWTVEILSTDNIIEGMAYDYATTYDAIWSNAIKLATDLFWKQFYNCVNSGKDIIIDRTNMSRKSRKRFLDVLKKNGYEITAVICLKPAEDEWKRRLDRPGKTIPEDALKSMQEQYQEPTLEEGFTSVRLAV